MSTSETTTFDGVNPIKLTRVANSIPIIKSLKTTLKMSSIENFIFTELSKLPNYQSYKSDISIVLHAYNLVENLISKSKQGETKQQIILNVFTKLFGLNSDEIIILKRNIDFLCETKQIKKLSKIYGG